jgi:hypothetical protein
MTVDLNKAYYSRDEMIKAIEALKEKHLKEANINASKLNLTTSNTSNIANAASPLSMVKDIEVLNSKLAELQNEINRLTLMQQQPLNQHTSAAQKPLSKPMAMASILPTVATVAGLSLPEDSANIKTGTDSNLENHSG